MGFPTYRPSGGTATYVIGARVAEPHALETSYLTVSDVLHEQMFFGVPSQSALSIDELETWTIEADPDFHSTVVERLGRRPTRLIKADELL